MKRKIISAVLALSIIMSCFIAANYTATAATTDIPDTYSDITANPYGMADSIDDSTILQAWNWSYNNIKDKLDLIGQQGFTTIQISPPNEIKEGTKGHKLFESDNGWWMFYQPAGFQINQSEDNALGTKSELIAMVKAAHAKGIKVIADSVINHMGTNGDENNYSSDPMDHVTPRAAQFEPEIINNKLFHKPWENMVYVENYYEKYEILGNRYPNDQDIEYWLTQTCTSKLPDLDTSSQIVQDAIYDYLLELVNCGIDGFRFDAAKHIETPSDTYYPSDFWDDTVIKVKNYAKNTLGKDLLSYGEILNKCGDGREFSEYFPYMKVTDSGVNWDIAGAVESGNGAGAVPMYMKNDSSSNGKVNTVLWNESHDTWENNSTRDFSKEKRNKTWAAIASRDGIASLYFARPASADQYLGEASETDWTCKEVSEVNKFSNFYSGQSEDLRSSGSIAVIGRGNASSNGGAVIINCSGTSTNISSVPTPTLADGTYTDHISGSTFTVKSGKVKGSIGSTGIAVLYYDGPSVSASDIGEYTTSTKTVTLKSAKVARATYSINANDEVEYENGTLLTVGTTEDTYGATYVIELKGYDANGAEVASGKTFFTKVPPTVINVNPNGVLGWNGQIYVYAWNENTGAQNSAWPGVAMTAAETGFTYDIGAGYKSVIFNTGNGGKQTVDLAISGSTDFTILDTTVTDSGSVKYNADSTSVPDPTYDIYFPNFKAWTFESTFQFGDVNRSNSVDINDVTMIQQRLVNLITFDVEQLNLADFDRNGKLNIHDATAIQYSLVNL